ncbi:MAG TPA: HAMP domain-containing protein [Methanospirillum sp.]|uniref:HAMP domain-containing protein n=1 Tax=Methanospirillum sp. TaxID=45200 RepID=UPI002BF4E7B9|nr:HAMP domain-containing protein [Methanospirillum sp.]HWQ64611.1 HAMP domain-containing protein [Methanospirillum sp.]
MTNAVHSTNTKKMKKPPFKLPMVEDEQLRSFYETFPIGLYRTSPEGSFLDFNSALIQLLGYPDRDTLMAVPLPALYYHPDTRIKWMQIMNHDGILRNFEIQLIKFNGTHIWVKNTGKAFFDESGTVRYYEGSIEDISERKQIEDDLKQSNEELHVKTEELTAKEQELRGNFQELLKKEQELMVIMERNSTILDAIPDIMFIISDEGVFLDSHIPKLSSSSDQIDFVGKNIRTIGLSSEMIEVFQQKIAQTLKDKDLCQFEYEHILSGRRKYYEARLKILNEHQVLIIDRDITDRKEQDIKIKDAISQINTNMETLSTLNDQIRNPLTIISTLTDDVEKTIADKINQQVDAIDHIIDLLDQRLIRSEKIRNFLLKHYLIPIKQLTEVANRVSMGDLEADVEKISCEEIDELTDSFKRMINAFKIMEAINSQLQGDEEQSEETLDFLMEHYVRPVQKLTEIAKQISMGDLNTEINVETRNSEIGELVESFRRLINAFKIMNAMNQEDNG